MDFVVVGLGVGALAILLGLTIRELGSRWWSIRPDDPLSSPEQVRRLAIGRVSRAGGVVLSLAGGLILIATIAAIALGLPDRTGAIVVMAIVTIAVLGTVAWGAVYASRYHPREAIRPRHSRPTPGPPADERPSLAGTIDAAFGDASDSPADASRGDAHPVGDSLDTPPSDSAIAADVAGTTDASGSTGPDDVSAGAVTDSADAPDASEAPESHAGAIPDATQDEPPTRPGAPVPERTSPVAATTGRDAVATDHVPADGIPFAAPNPKAANAHTGAPSHGPEQFTEAYPAATSATGSTTGTQNPNRSPATATGGHAGMERAAPAGGAPGEPLTDGAPPRPGQSGLARRDRST